MNKAVLMGRLTRDADLRYTQGENAMAVARFTLAVDRRGKKQDTADFISCVVFGKTAEALDKYCRKGTKICLDGHIQTGSYTNKDGVKVYTTDVIVDSWEFAESKAVADQNTGGDHPAADEGGFVEVSKDEKLPWD